MKKELTAERLRELLSYDPATGLFMRHDMRGASKKGWMQGSANASGHLVMGVAGKTYLGHRLAWLWVHGVWPTHEIDHINGNPADNRLVNLRDVPKSINMQNLKQARSDNKTSGLLGATLHKPSGRWVAQLSVGGKKILHKHFDTAQQAHDAYLLAKRQHHVGNTL